MGNKNNVITNPNAINDNLEFNPHFKLRIYPSLLASQSLHISIANIQAKSIESESGVTDKLD